MLANHEDTGISSNSFDRPADRRLAAIMFTDMVGYTSMTENNETLALELLEEHRRILRPKFAIHGGEEIKTIGDSFLVEFRSALETVKCALEIQEALSQRNAESTSLRQIQVRIGIHVGDVVKVGKDVYGDAVNLASRIEPLSEPGGVAMSAQVYEQVKNKITYPVDRMGEYKLKNVSTPTVVYRARPAIRSGKPIMENQETLRRLAVLPLLMLGHGDEYLADGLTEELISAFSRLRALKVIARTTMMRYKSSSKSLSEIGSELKASTILEGSVRQYGKRLRITVQLVEASTEEYLWSATYDREVDDILEIQQDVAEKTVEALKSKIGDEARSQPAAKRITKSSDAFLLYLKGRYHLARHTETEVKLASDLFDQAVKLDPNFAAAHAMYAQCHMLLGFYGFISPQEGFEKALPSLKRAIKIDNDLDVAHMLMGRLMQDRWDWLGAEAEFRRAIEISPNSSEAHYSYALLLSDLRRNSEALAEVKMAEELDPLSVPVNQIAGTVMYFGGKYRDAIEKFQRALDIDPKAAMAHNNLGLALFEEGKAEEGISEIKEALEMDPNNMMFRVDLCYLLGRAGKKDDARDVLMETMARANSQRVSPVAIAGMYACLGEKDLAIEWLDRAYMEHSPYLASLRSERWFDKIREDSKFRNMLRKIGVSEE